MAVEDFGERAATEDEVADWKTLVRAGKNASRGYRLPIGQTDDCRDQMRPAFGSGRASSEGDA